MRVTTVERCDRLDFEADLNKELAASEEIGSEITDVRITPYVMQAEELVCYFAAIYFEPAEDEE